MSDGEAPRRDVRYHSVGNDAGDSATVRPQHMRSPRLGQINFRSATEASAIAPRDEEATIQLRRPPKSLSREAPGGKRTDAPSVTATQRAASPTATSGPNPRSKRSSSTASSASAQPGPSQTGPAQPGPSAQRTTQPPVRRQGGTSAASGQLAHYSLGDCLGRGAFGSVYRGLNWMTGETVAVKQIGLSNIPESELGEIMSEIELLRNLKHPNIVKYKGSEKTVDHLYIILEYCENGSLHHICRKFGKFPESLVGVYILQVLQGLVYLHEQGVIHRDIKGANILTNKDGSVKLADFGVATKTGALTDYAVVGSPYWMAPEVIDQSGATTTSDIWSVGCVVIELLEGKPPYSDLEPMPALFRIVQDDCPPLPESASAVVKDFLLQCFQKEANLRASAQNLLRHPWMASARKQLEQMRSGGSMRTTLPTAHEEAVKSVQEWNQILQDPPPKDIQSAAPPKRRGDGSVNANQDPLHYPSPKKASAVSLPRRPLQPSTSTNAGPANARIQRDRSWLDTPPQHVSTDADSNWDDDFEGQLSTSALSGKQRLDSAALALPRAESNGTEPAEALTQAIRSASRPNRDSTTYTGSSPRDAEASPPPGRAPLGGTHSMPQLRRTPSAPLRQTSGYQSSQGEDLRRSLGRYSEAPEEDDYESAFLASTKPGLSLTESLLSSKSGQLDHFDDDREDEDGDRDPFGELDEELCLTEDLGANAARDKHARMCEYVADLAASLESAAHEEGAKIVDLCDQLVSAQQPIMSSYAYPLTTSLGPTGPCHDSRGCRDETPLFHESWCSRAGAASGVCSPSNTIVSLARRAEPFDLSRSGSARESLPRWRHSRRHGLYFEKVQQRRPSRSWTLSLRNVLVQQLDPAVRPFLSCAQNSGRPHRRRLQ